MDKKKEQEMRMKTIVYDIDNANKNCADCGKESMDYASINNGTIICEECAEKHKKLGNGISFLRGFNEKWDDYLLNYLRTGGNSRFVYFAKSYHISQMDILLKYKTRACEYYRDILRSEVMGYDPPDNINLNTASEVLEVIDNNYPEFENYTFVKHVDLDSLEKNVKKVEEETGFFGTMKGFFGSVTKKFDNAKDMIANINMEETLESVKNMAGTAKGRIIGFVDDIVGEKVEETEESKEKAVPQEEKKEIDKKTENSETQIKEEIKEQSKKEAPKTEELSENKNTEEIKAVPKQEIKEVPKNVENKAEETPLESEEDDDFIKKMKAIENSN